MIFKIRSVIKSLLPNKMHPSHLWHPSRSTTATLIPLGIVIVFGGRVCVVSNFVLSSFNIEPTCANATTSSSSKRAAGCHDVARTKMSSANLTVRKLEIKQRSATMFWVNPFRSHTHPPSSRSIVSIVSPNNIVGGPRAFGFIVAKLIFL